jgi:hypothetical protein
MMDLNEELRDLIEQERNAYNEERVNAESENAQVKKTFEAKIKIMKNKLLVLISPNDIPISSGHDLDSQDITIDDLVRKVSDYIYDLKH